ncbi:uncharacterized protein LOC141612598 [Silene latifolia]|uniref:uncharacterized protein LOC141612598 n=1 Tax=Silene latifolia TaxID=37657 RepID=UPI003D77BF5E
MNNVGFFGLIETRVKTINVNKVQQGLGSHWQFLNNNDILDRGRIWVLWDASQFSVVELGKEIQVVHLRVTHLSSGFSWVHSLVYGCKKDSERVDLWNSLKQLKQSLVDPWLIMGDFNNVLHSDERIGSPITQAEVQGFQDCVDECGLYDVRLGAFFTWNNKQEGVARVFSRIDRVMCKDL